MFEVNTMHAPRRPSVMTARLVLPVLALTSCVSQADMFQSKPDGLAEAGSGAPSAGAEPAISTELGSDTDSIAPTGTPPASAVTRDEHGATSGATSGVPTEGATEGGADPTSRADSASSESDSGTSEGAVAAGDVPAELVGVWQQTATSNPDYEAEFGETLSEVSGFSVQLKISAEGRYHLAHYSSGMFGDCEAVTRFDESVGTATLDGNVLTLEPASRRIDTANCEGDASDDTNREPIVLTVRLAEGHEAYGGLRTFVMAAEGYGFPLSLTSLFREPTYIPEQPSQPDEFVLGVNGPFADLQGMWLASEDTDSNFYDPNTGEFYFPELDSSSHRWLRFDGGGYETAVALQNVNSEGVCKLDLIYYERGAAAFEVLEDVEGLGSHFVGHVALLASDSRLIVNIRECDGDDGVRRYDLEPLTSYFQWVYHSPDRPPESFSVNCEFARSEWQSLLCDDGAVAFIRPP